MVYFVDNTKNVAFSVGKVAIHKQWKKDEGKVAEVF